MTMLSSTQISKTTDENVFQSQSKTLFECILGNPNVKENGKRGNSQQGVDLYGRRKNKGLDHWVGIQCKCTQKNKPIGTVRDEATQALNFKPDLKEYIIVTKAEDNASLDEQARIFTDEQARKGRDFEVQVWGWHTLCTHIIKYEASLKAFAPGSSPFIDKVLIGQGKILEESHEHTNQLHGMVSQLEVLISKSSAIEMSLDTSTFTSHLDQQIDQYRDLLLENKPITSKQLLEKLQDNLPEGTKLRIRYRIKANIAACLLRLNRVEEAAEGLIEAYHIAPAATKADAHKVLGLTLKDSAEEAVEFGLSCLATTEDKAALVSNIITARR